MRSNFIAAVLALPIVAACGSTEQWEKNQQGLALATQQLETDGSLQAVAIRMQSLLDDTQEDPREFELQRFFAAFMLAQVHASASLGEEYLTEKSGVPGFRPAGGGDPNQSLSTNRHVLAAFYNASLAREWFGGAVRSGPKYEDVTLLPPDLSDLGVENADLNLVLIVASSLSRFNFDERVRKLLDESVPAELFELESCLEALDRLKIPEELRPWVALMIFHHLKADSIEEAYRFGVIAVEGEKRFGRALPEKEVAAVEEWITGGAPKKFICPKDRLVYLSGEDSCPNDATPHLEYIAVEKD